MKNQLWAVFIGCFLSIAASAQEVKVEGKVLQGVEQVALLVFNAESLGYDQQQLVQVKQGAFELTWRFDQPNLYKLKAGEKEIRLAVSQPGKITVTFLRDGTNIKGSQESLDMLLFAQKNDALQARHFGALKKEADQAMAAGDRAALAEIQKKSAKAIQEFLVEFRAAIVDLGVGPGGYYALQFSDFTKEIEFIKKRLALFQEQIPDSPVTRALAMQVYRSTVVAIGAVPPAINTTDKEGNAFSLDQYAGKVLLIDFWAAWCRACRIENPQFVDLYNEFHDQGLEIVSISQDEKLATWETAIAKDGVGIWRQLQDADRRISDLYSVSSLPQNVVLGRDGKIIAKNVTAEQLKTLLKDHL